MLPELRQGRDNSAASVWWHALPCEVGSTRMSKSGIAPASAAFRDARSPSQLDAIDSWFMVLLCLPGSRQSRRPAMCCFVHWTESAQDSFCTDTYCITGDLSIVGWYLLEICDHLSIVGLQPEPAFHSTAGPLDVLLLSMTSVAKQQASSWPKPRRNTAEPHRLLIAEALLFQYLLST